MQPKRGNKTNMTKFNTDLDHNTNVPTATTANTTNDIMGSHHREIHHDAANKQAIATVAHLKTAPPLRAEFAVKLLAVSVAAQRTESTPPPARNEQEHASHDEP